jgi:hypothetical protein
MSLAAKILEWYIIATILCIEIELNGFISSVNRLLLEADWTESNADCTVTVLSRKRTFCDQNCQSCKTALRRLHRLCAILDGRENIWLRSGHDIRVIIQKVCNIINITYEVLSAVAMKSFTLWDITDLPEEHVPSNFRVKSWSRQSELSLMPAWLTLRP